MPAEEATDRQLGILWGGVAVALVALSPLASLFAAAAPRCLFKAWTGLPCPTCGTTRAALALARFDFLQAFTRYPLPSLAWTFFIAGGLVAGWLAWRRRPLPALPRRLPLWVKVAAVAAVLLNWAYAVHTGV